MVKFILPFLFLILCVFTLANISTTGGSSPNSTQPGKEAVEIGNKIVPVLNIGDGIRIGLVQVSGPKEYVEKVKAVAALEGDFKDLVRYRALVPIETEKIVENIKRVPFVAVSGVVDLKVS